jgi:MATE family, multidrug efflux pump
MANGYDNGFGRDIGNKNQQSDSSQQNSGNSHRSDKRRLSLARDWTQGSITRNLLTLAWPVVISNSLNMLGPTIDMVWVGRLGPASMAAVGISGQVVLVAQALLQGVFTSLRAMVSRRIGEKDDKGANRAFQQAFIIGVGLSIIMAAIGILLSNQLVGLFGAATDVAALAVPYNRIQFIGMVTIVARMITEATMQSSGDTKTAMWIGVIFRIIHMVFCPFLVFGLWIFPELGVKGAALMGVISQGLGGAIGFFILMAGFSRLHVSFKDFRLDFHNIWLQIRIGIPSSINQMLRSFVGLFIVRFIVPFGTLSVAAHSLEQRIESFLEVACGAFGNASGALGGQNLGAGKPERAQKTGWLAIGFATSVMTIISLVVFIFPANVVRIFNNDPDLVKIASVFIRIGIVNFIMMGPASVLTSFLNGVGDTMIPLIASLVSMWGMQLPLAAFLPKVGNLGVYGIRWAMAIALSARAITYVIYFKWGRWKHRRL